MHSNRFRRPTPLVLIVALALLAGAAPAGAATWIVELENGNRFESRYQPEAASWDSSLVLLLTSAGNHIALERDDIASVRSDVEEQGFGTVIDNKTISLGLAPDHLAAPGTEGGAPESPEMQMLRAFMESQQPAQQQNINVPQFVDPGMAGFAGLPASGVVTGGAPATAPLAPPGNAPFAAPGLVTAPPSTSFPIQGSAVPAQGSTVPVQGSTVPVQGSTVPAQGSAVPLQTAPPSGQ
ncbi:MAG TPA: hypothetical protein VHQ65_17210 [Thermoanaerobaculia bacterium]|nr:hypothetical protein [Thermoanaerobaculia bacterium]